MKQLTSIVLIGIALALGSLALAAEEKTKAKEPEKSASTTTAGHVMLNPADVKWMDAPPSLPAGAKMAVLEGDPGKAGPFTVRLQTPAGYKIPPHTHPTAEAVTVISGTFHLGHGPKFDEANLTEMKAGGFAVMPAGMQHFVSSKGECIVQVHAMGPFEINYVNPADDPRQTKK